MTKQDSTAADGLPADSVTKADATVSIPLIPPAPAPGSVIVRARVDSISADGRQCWLDIRDVVSYGMGTPAIGPKNVVINVPESFLDGAWGAVLAEASANRLEYIATLVYNPDQIRGMGPSRGATQSWSMVRLTEPPTE